MLQQELSKIALLGAENSSFSEETKRGLQRLGIDISQEAPQALAQAAALLSQMHKAGFRLADFEGSLPEAASAGDERLCSFRSSERLRLILDGTFGGLLPEFFEILIKNKKCLPPEHLPALLNRPDRKKWKPFLEKTLSASGRWFLSQHPIWRKWVEKPEGDWLTGTREERLQLMAWMRRCDPEAGLQLLQSTWKEESPADKKAFLQEVLQAGLSMSDEPFLERCLDDRRQEVRAVAAEALQNLPDSRLAGRMFQRAIQALPWDGIKIAPQLPDNLDAEARRDGILKKSPLWTGGDRANYLGQVVAAVPPERWETYLKKLPTEIVQIFAATDWADTLLSAGALSAARHRDETWTEALLAWQLFRAKEEPTDGDPFFQALSETASAAGLNRLALQFISLRKNLPTRDTAFFQLLQMSGQAWDDPLSLRIAELLQSRLNEASQPGQLPEGYKEYFSLLALRANPALLPKLQNGWNANAPLRYLWEKPLEEMMNALLFRKEMNREMKTD